MRTFGGTPGRPANESNNAHFPHRATRFVNHAFHWAPGAATRTWPRGSVPANVAHFNIQIGNPFTHTTHAPTYVTHNAGHYTHHHVHTGGGAAGNAGGAGNAGVAGNAGAPGTNGTGGSAGSAGLAGTAGLGGAGGAGGAAGASGSAGAAGSDGKDGGIIVVTDSWGLVQTLSSSTKIILNV